MHIFLILRRPNPRIANPDDADDDDDVLPGRTIYIAPYVGLILLID